MSSDNTKKDPAPAPAPSMRPSWKAWLGWAIMTVAVLTLDHFLGTFFPPPLPPDFGLHAGDSYSFGWVQRPAEVREIVAGMKIKTFGDTPAGQSQDPLPNDVFLWQAYQKLFGELPPCKNQGQLGSCVSFGTNNAIETTEACAIVYDKQPFEFKHIAEEVTYGGSRVEIGGGKLGRGDGSTGAWAAKFAHDYGVIARDVYNIDGQTYDLTSYDVSRCRQWGNSGVPKGLETVAKQHPVQSTTLIASWADAKRALSQGYGISVCSNQGFTMQRDANGICSPRGSWGHCMACTGYHIEGTKEYGHIENSWGPSAMTGPVGWGNPSTAGFWAESGTVDRMIKAGDSWAFSSMQGFPKKKTVDWYASLHNNPKLRNPWPKLEPRFFASIP